MMLFQIAMRKSLRGFCLSCQSGSTVLLYSDITIETTLIIILFQSTSSNVNLSGSFSWSSPSDASGVAGSVEETGKAAFLTV